MRFRPEQHLRRPRDFERVRAGGRRYDAGPFTLFYAPRGATSAASAASVASGASACANSERSESDVARAGFVASRSAVGNAVARARAKRRLREGFRAHQSAFPPGLDLIFVARRSLNGLEHAVLAERFSILCRKLFSPRAA
ncbi:MAG: ribonuclease P protein component [Verrucomicrobia bacterium]|nr:MAG: ribonuclease P protein component [Verrucomicrobiota bacterium]